MVAGGVESRIAPCSDERITYENISRPYGGRYRPPYALPA